MILIHFVQTDQFNNSTELAVISEIFSQLANCYEGMKHLAKQNSLRFVNVSHICFHCWIDSCKVLGYKHSGALHPKLLLCFVQVHHLHRVGFWVLSHIWTPWDYFQLQKDSALHSHEACSPSSRSSEASPWKNSNSFKYGLSSIWRITFLKASLKGTNFPRANPSIRHHRHSLRVNNLPKIYWEHKLKEWNPEVLDISGIWGLYKDVSPPQCEREVHLWCQNRVWGDFHEVYHENC